MRKCTACIKKSTVISIIALLSILFITELSATENAMNLGSLQADWTTVMGGNALFQPQRSSYGFVFAGEGRMLYSCTKDGTVLWQRGIPANPKQNILVTPDDFIAVITNNYMGRSCLSLVNPSGSLLWTAEAPLTVADAPFAGRDGRIFVRSADGIACFGINGICKWYIRTEPQDMAFAPAELNDGSWVLLCAQRQDGKSTALRVDPFGRIGERITLPGTVGAIAASSGGILLSLSDGTAGLLRADRNGAIVQAWVTESHVSSGKTAILINERKSQALFVSGGSSSRAVVLDIKTGAAQSEFTLPDIGTQRVLCSSVYADAFALADESRAALFLWDGRPLSSAVLPPSTQRKFVFMTDEAVLAVCTSDWVVKGWKLASWPGKKIPAARKSTYAALYSAAQWDVHKSGGIQGHVLTGAQLALMERTLTLSGFDAGSMERVYDQQENELRWEKQVAAELGEILAHCGSDSAQAAKQAPTLYETDIEYCAKVIAIAGKFGADSFNKQLSQIATSAKDSFLVTSALAAMGTAAYDPEGTMLTAIEQVIRTGRHRKNTSVLETACDAILDICRFNGKSAFFRKGRSLLSTLMGSSYPSEVRDYASAAIIKVE